eukprot:CAMPEP_0171031284 /NCGR_PEP_ID=MMETSP0736-20130129/37542_1 /TAXON_ID=186038 /ORGANISM="Fragilariopsis kerguelensis, Strain L26-C5" /LENGTH=119 /DNA_ID=CAMNT_0011473493 /DNA_START=501 /DNA_END=860 /DNA_ORIENTATION=+
MTMRNNSNSNSTNEWSIVNKHGPSALFTIIFTMKNNPFQPNDVRISDSTYIQCCQSSTQVESVSSHYPILQLFFVGTITTYTVWFGLCRIEIWNAVDDDTTLIHPNTPSAKAVGTGSRR